MSKFNLREWLDKVVCGCGRPEEAVSLVHDLLRFLKDRYNDAPDWSNPNTTTWEEWGVRDDARLNAILPDGRVRWAMWYWLDQLGLTEHGGGVPGWPEPFGELVLAALDADMYVIEDDDRERRYHSLDPEEDAATA